MNMKQAAWAAKHDWHIATIYIGWHRWQAIKSQRIAHWLTLPVCFPVAILPPFIPNS